MRMQSLLLIFAVALFPAVVQAHKPSDSYLTLRVEGANVEGQWDIALRDLDFAVGLDTDADGRIRWGELESRAEAVDAYAQSRLAIAAAGTLCPTRVESHQVDRHSDGAYAVLRFRAACPSTPASLLLDYGLLFDLDPQHRGLLRIEGTGGAGAATAIFSADARRQEIEIGAPAGLRTFATYTREGIWHIWIGYDHVLFLLSLLLPAVLFREAGRWHPATRLRPALADLLGVVSAFTVAHSITLSLAALGLVSIPSRLVESAIAASVVLAALNNLWPVVEGRRWAVAFGFGLIHGLGFASVLADLGLPRATLVTALLAFNVGVESGQLAIVLAVAPVAWLLRESALYRRVVFAAGSAAIALLAGIWLLERGFDVRFFGAS